MSSPILVIYFRVYGLARIENHIAIAPWSGDVWRRLEIRGQGTRGQGTRGQGNKGTGVIDFGPNVPCPRYD